MPFKEKIASRKFVLMLSILVLSSAILLIPIFLAAFTSAALVPLMSGGEFATLIIGSYGLYVGGNVLTKKVLPEVKEGSDV